MSYGEVAAAIRSGPRAVGNACGANPYPIVVPCHRVIAANQALGGFGKQGGGFLLDIKKWLLLHEHAGF
jgi:methylated-DNA-[protein]-cysteine S-methyltransferase